MIKNLRAFMLLFLFGLVDQMDAQFIENKGQWPHQIAFKTDLPTGTLWAENDRFTWLFYEADLLKALHPSNPIEANKSTFQMHAYQVVFEGASPAATHGSKPAASYYNYYLDNEPGHWAHHCQSFGRCDYEALYPGIDLVLYTKNNAIKYDFVVHPGSNPEVVKMRFDGDVDLSLSETQLIIRTSVNVVTELAPFTYQLINGQIHEVASKFVIVGHTVGFEVGEYDPNYDLVIDPEIAFSTYIGSTASNFGFTACDDNQGNMISGANVYSAGYPTTLGAYQINFSGGGSNLFDAAISKFDNTGSNLLYSTYLGGTRQDAPHSIVADSQDHFIVMGVTGSSNFPVTFGSYQTTYAGGPYLDMQASDIFTGVQDNGTDFFITKFNADGTIFASTFVGGTGIDGLNYAPELFYNYGDVFRGEVNVDENDRIYVASVTRSQDFPMINATQPSYGGGDCDGVVFCLNSNLNGMVWSTYFGGSAPDACYAVEFSNNGSIVIAGGTQSSDFPHVSGGDDMSWNGATDGFVSKLNATSYTLQNGTFVGTPEYDQIYFVQFDLDDNVYVYGQTMGDMPISPGLYGQANSGQFIRKLSPQLNNSIWNTVVGSGNGGIDISPTAFLVSDCQQIYISGWGGEVNNYCGLIYSCSASNSSTNNLPITSDAFQSTTDGSDFYICVLSPNASDILYGTYLGGTESSEHVDGGTSRFDKNGSVFQAVCAGCQGNSDFPTTPNVWSNTNPSFGCNIAVFRFDLGMVNALVEIDGPDEVCEGQEVNFNNLSSGASNYTWTFGDGATSSEFEPSHIYETSGQFNITLIGYDVAECLAPDTTVITITILPGVNPQIETPDPICPGTSITLQGIGSPTAFWLDDPTLSATTILNPTASPSVTQIYYLVDSNTCETDTASVALEVIDVVTGISPNPTICIGQSATITATGGGEYVWTPSTGLSNTSSSSVIASPTITTTYTAQITTLEGCEAEEEITVTVISDAPGGDVYPDLTICKGSSVTLQGGDGNTWQWSPSNSLSNAFIQNPIASPLQTTTYAVVISNACGTGTDQVTVNVLIAEIIASEGGTICSGSTFAANASGGISYSWQPASLCAPPNQSSTTLYPLSTTTFVVTGIDENNCGDTDSLTVYVLPAPLVDAGPDQYFDVPGSAQLFGNAFGFPYSWSPTEGLSCTDCPYPIANPEVPTYYTLIVTDGNGCMAMDSVFVKPYYPLWVPNTITPNNDGINDVFRAYGTYIEGYSLKIFDRWGVKIFETTDFDQVWTGGISEDYYVQNDTYVWVIEYDTLERREKLIGHVNVIR